jgi:hypothetical protein
MIEYLMYVLDSGYSSPNVLKISNTVRVGTGGAVHPRKPGKPSVCINL